MALSTQRAPRWRYDVFLSFRGEDTRMGFVSHLYRALQRQLGPTVFMDDRELEGGKSISVELPSAIKESNIAVVVFSPDYASSKWCLNELTDIVQCMEGRDSILPIFYHVDPSHVRNQSGSFAEAFAKHEQKLISTEQKKMVKQWKTDLKKVASLSGWDSKNYKDEGELIELLVNCVWRKVRATMKLSDSSQKLVGIDSALDQLSLLLAHDANDVGFIGITGMGGIGKTTLAKLVFDRISHQFEVAHFFENVRETSARDGTLVRLQKKLLSSILTENIQRDWDENDGVLFAARCLYNKKVLLVLDDVDQLSQLEKLARRTDWFGMGSRIIITTRNERLLVEHGIARSYPVEALDYGEALELFSRNAFRKDQPEEDFLELSKCFVRYAKGLPLALKVLGSSLYNRGRDAWNSALENLEKIPIPTVFDSLKISYDALEETEKMIFLDVACLYKGKYRKEVIEMLNNTRDISNHIWIDRLIEKSLFVIEQPYNTIQMHDLVQEMAWEIVRRESEEPGQRSRLWRYDDIFHVFRTNTGTGAIEAIVLCLSELKEMCDLNCEAFSKMHNLKVLVFDNVIISSSPTFLPYSLRTLHWSWNPSKFLPPAFQLDSLTELSMHNSKLVLLWDGRIDFPKLKKLDVSCSYELTNTPDFSGLPNLEELYLMNCKNLIEIHKSIAFLKRLKYLGLDGCTSIESLPSEVEMNSLENFQFGGQMRNLYMLGLNMTAIEKIPSSIENLVGLGDLDLDGCKSLVGLPNTIGNWKSLKCLNMEGCSKLKKIPEFEKEMGNLSELKLRGAAIEKIPSSIENLVLLEFLDLSNCKSLLSLPSAINLKSLNKLHMKGCSKLKKIPDFGEQMRNLSSLELSGSAIEKIPSSIDNLVGLGYLNLSDCKSLVGLPGTLNRLCSLWWLDLRNCNLWEGDIPDDIGHCLSSLRNLHFGGNNFVSLPASIRCLARSSIKGQTKDITHQSRRLYLFRKVIRSVQAEQQIHQFV